METNCEELICRTISPLRCSSPINVIVSHYLLTALSQSAFKSLGGNWLNNTFILPKTSREKVFSPQCD